MAAKFKPYVLRSTHQMVNEEVLVVHDSFGGAVRVLRRPLVMPGVGWGVKDDTLLPGALPGGIWPVWQASNTPLHSILTSIKVSLLEHGGTPEAVRLYLLFGELSKKELTMASDKLAGKSKPAPAADKPAKAAKAPKAAPAPAPAAKADKAPAADKPKKALPPALQKAADAKKAASSARDGLKVQVLTEKKANPYREGTKAHATFELFKANHGKTVGDIKAAADADAHDLGYLRYADRDGYIKIG